MTEQQLKEWIAKNVEIRVEPTDPYGPTNDVYVGLRFVGEHHYFTHERISIPEQPLDR